VGVVAVDVFEASPREYRARQGMAIVPALLLGTVALVPYPDVGLGSGYLTLWWVRLPALLAALLFLYWASGSSRPVTLPVLEIGPDAIRWTYGPKQRTIARAAVAKVHADAQWLRFSPAPGEKILEINLLTFDWRAVRAALERHGWS
jgi:hypothetical protein